MRWEYKNVVLWFPFDPTHLAGDQNRQIEVDRQLNILGEAGWEMISGYEHPRDHLGGQNDGKTSVQVRFKRQR